MIKSIRVIFVFACISVLIVACKNPESKQIKNDSLATVNTVHKDTISATNNSTPKDYSEIGSEIMNNEKIGEIKFGISLSEVNKILGKPDKIEKAELWGADDEYHQTMTYTNSGITIDYIGKNVKSKTVNMITITSPCNFKTSKSIGIGSSLKDVQAAYKESINPELSNSESITAGTEFGGIVFDFENKLVKSIFIGASAE